LVVLDRGRVVAEGTPASIVGALGGRATVRFTDAALDVEGLRSLPGVDRVDRHGAEVRVSGSGPLLAHVGARLVALDRPPLDLRVQLPTLEDRFVALTQEAS
ncbi:MAG: ABC transporter ATP-binding protein, partial [Actinomycetota bacterium]|nr:ABC transporter ATP-binding protein [Actinomycetota bacterium]